MQPPFRVVQPTILPSIHSCHYSSFVHLKLENVVNLTCNLYYLHMKYLRSFLLYFSDHRTIPACHGDQLQTYALDNTGPFSDFLILYNIFSRINKEATGISVDLFESNVGQLMPSDRPKGVLAQMNSQPSTFLNKMANISILLQRRKFLEMFQVWSPNAGGDQATRVENMHKII